MTDRRQQRKPPCRKCAIGRMLVETTRTRLESTVPHIIRYRVCDNSRCDHRDKRTEVLSEADLLSTRNRT